MERSIRSVGGKPSGARHRGGAACAPRQAKCGRARIHRQPFQRGQIIRDGLIEGRLPRQRPDQKVVIRVGRCVGQSIGTEAVPVQPVTNCGFPGGPMLGQKGQWPMVAGRADVNLSTRIIRGVAFQPSIKDPPLPGRGEAAHRLNIRQSQRGGRFVTERETVRAARGFGENFQGAQALAGQSGQARGAGESQLLADKARGQFLLGPDRA